MTINGHSIRFSFSGFIWSLIVFGFSLWLHYYWGVTDSTALFARTWYFLLGASIFWVILGKVLDFVLVKNITAEVLADFFIVTIIGAVLVGLSAIFRSKNITFFNYGLNLQWLYLGVAFWGRALNFIYDRYVVNSNFWRILGLWLVALGIFGYLIVLLALSIIHVTATIESVLLVNGVVLILVSLGISSFVYHHTEGVGTIFFADYKFKAGIGVLATIVALFWIMRQLGVLEWYMGQLFFPLAIVVLPLTVYLLLSAVFKKDVRL